jgi:hypothetical protein
MENKLKNLLCTKNVVLFARDFSGKGLTLRHHGVTEFATRNETHFTGFGFNRLWNPLPA